MTSRVRAYGRGSQRLRFLSEWEGKHPCLPDCAAIESDDGGGRLSMTSRVRAYCRGSQRIRFLSEWEGKHPCLPDCAAIESDGGEAILSTEARLGTGFSTDDEFVSWGG